MLKKSSLSVASIPALLFVCSCAGAGAWLEPDPPKAGASMLFTTLEAEDPANITNGKVVTMDKLNFRTPEAEASGYGYVELRAAGDYLEFAKAPEANAIVLRHCIPDSPDGGGISATLGLYVNGERRQDLTLSSKHNWLYAKTANPTENGQDNKPTAYPHVFWDESKFFIKGGLKAGDKLRLQKDSQDAAAFYRIDLVDVELVPEPFSRPENSLSVADYGAKGQNPDMDFMAFKGCIDDAREQGKTVWIPPGSYLLNGELKAENVKIQGAGVWHSTLRFTDLPKKWTGVFHIGNRGSVSSLSIEGPLTARNCPLHAFTGGGANWSVKDVWITHTNTAFWIGGSDGVISGCRVRFTYADGINVNNGNKGAVSRILVENNHVRGTGDDGIAVLSQVHKGDALSTDDVTVRRNTSIAPWWASCCDLAGGRGHVIEENFFEGEGLVVNLPPSYPMLPQGKAVIRKNVLCRCGSSPTLQKRGALWIFPGSTGISDLLVEENKIVKPFFAGIDIQGSFEQKISFSRNLIEASGEEPVRVGPSAKGIGTFEGNVMTSASQDCLWWFDNRSKGGYKIVQSGNVWETQAKGQAAR